MIVCVTETGSVLWGKGGGRYWLLHSSAAGWLELVRGGGGKGRKGWGEDLLTQHANYSNIKKGFTETDT